MTKPERENQLVCRGRIYATLIFFTHHKGRIYAAPTKTVPSQAVSNLPQARISGNRRRARGLTRAYIMLVSGTYRK